eukprot:1104056-Prorocentrum_minimum.AAC.2
MKQTAIPSRHPFQAIQSAEPITRRTIVWQTFSWRGVYTWDLLAPLHHAIRLMDSWTPAKSHAMFLAASLVASATLLGQTIERGCLQIVEKVEAKLSWNGARQIVAVNVAALFSFDGHPPQAVR